jgi:hypothetical protein
MNARELLQHTFSWEQAPGIPTSDERGDVLVGFDCSEVTAS